MTRTRASSTSSTDAAVPGFRITRPIGRGPLGAVYEAVQESLDRPVALRIVEDERIAARLPRLRWPEHRSVVSLYASGRLETGGGYVAMRLVHGSSLASLKPAAREAISLLEQAAAALDAAHAQGVVHGSVRAGNVLVEDGGRALLSDFGLGPEDASVASDRRDFASLVQQVAGGAAPARASTAAAMVREAAGRLPSRRVPSPQVTAACVVGAGMVAGLGILLTGGKDDEPPGPPAVAPGARELGSALAAAGTQTVDCEGRAPGGASQACLIVQTGLPGRPVRADRSGAVRRWAVRGAEGRLALAVLRRQGRRFVWIARSDFVRVPNGEPRAFSADLPIRAGDFVGLVVTPGSGLGVARAQADAVTFRWLGRGVQVPILDSLSAVRGESTGFAEAPRQELLLRADYVPGARPRVPGLLTGRSARTAPAGQQLGSQSVEVKPGLARRPVVARVGGRVVLDLFDGPVRLTRVTVSAADPAGSLIDLGTYGKPVMRLRWLNPDGEVVIHDYAVGARSLRPRS